LQRTDLEARMRHFDLTARPGADRTVRALLAAALIGTLLVLAACGGSDESSSTTSASSASGAAKTTAGDGQPAGTVEDQLGFDQAGLIARQSRVEAAIGQCMSNEGFEYVPIDPLAQRAALVGSSRLSDEDFLQQFGYGISTLWGRGNPQADPNQSIRASLGAADRRAYDRTLWGENKGASFSEAIENGHFDRLGGCTLEATEQVFGGAQVLIKLQGKLDVLDERILEDQRMVRAIESWSLCMADAGFRYEDPEEIDADLFKRMETIVGPLPGQFATGPPAGEKAQPYDRTALRDLQREEVAIARADFTCEEKRIAPVEEVVRPQYEAQFRRQNQGLISSVRPVR
jgi:hypothetical protein